MKLAFICTEKLPSPAIRGGAIQIMIDGITPFLRKNHDITIFSITDPNLVNEENHHGIKYIRLPRVGYETLVAEQLKRNKFDVIHVCNRPRNVLKYKEAAPKSAFVLSLHNDMFSEMKIAREEALQVIESVDAITTVSEYIKRTVIYRYPVALEKIHVVYSGVNLNHFTPTWTIEGKAIRQKIVSKYQLENKKVILFVGRLSKTKGPHVLIESMQHILIQHPEAVLVIVGGKWFSDNTKNEYVKELYDQAMRFKGHVLFTEYIPSDQIPEMLLIGNVFVCCSQWHEPLARVHYEAMAAGLPIITTNRGGNAEVIEEGVNGLIIDDYVNPKSFAQAIDCLFSNPHLSETMGVNGREKVEGKYQFHHVATTLEKLYLEVLDQNEEG